MPRLKLPNKNDLVNVSFEVGGVVQLDRALGVLKTNVSDLSPVWDDIKDDFIKNEREQFNTEGGHGSGGWAPLSASYAKWKRRHYPRKKILVLKGNLRGSLTSESAPGFHYKHGKLGMEIGSRVKYALFHQTGTKTMPSRPPIELVDAQKRRWPRLIHEYIWKSGQGFSRAVIKAVF